MNREQAINEINKAVQDLKKNLRKRPKQINLMTDLAAFICMHASALLTAQGAQVAIDERLFEKSITYGEDDEKQFWICVITIEQIMKQTKGWGDFLSETMEIESNLDGNLGQFMTPWDICYLMIKLQEAHEKTNWKEPKKQISFHEPSCGSGATIMAALKLRYDTNTMHKTFIEGIDLDIDILKIAVAQITLLQTVKNIHIGEVMIYEGNALTDKKQVVFHSKRAKMLSEMLMGNRATN